MRSHDHQASEQHGRAAVRAGDERGANDDTYDPELGVGDVTAPTHPSKQPAPSTQLAPGPRYTLEYVADHMSAGGSEWADEPRHQWPTPPHGTPTLPPALRT
jgi:hypothetical protein